MASTLQLAIEDVQLNDYTTRMLVHLGAFRPLTLMLFLVAILTAVGYDYSKQYTSVCVSSRLTILNIVSPHILRRGMPHII